MSPERCYYVLLPVICIMCMVRILAAEPELIDRVAAVIDDEIILWSELNYRVQVSLEERGYRSLPPPAALDSLRRQVLGALVDEQVLILKAEKDSVIVDEKAIQELLNARYLDIKEGMSVAEFDEMLERSGLSERQLRSRLRKQIRAAELFRNMQQEVYYRTHITRKDVQGYRLAHGNGPPPVLSLSQIVIQVKPETSTLVAVEDRIATIEEKLAAGEDFSALARSFSEDPGSASTGGSLGCFGSGVLVPEFEAAVENLKPGEVSEPVLTQFGYHLIRLDEKREEEHCASHILLRAVVGQDDQGRVLRELTSLRQLALDGADFAALARVHSEDRQTALRGGQLAIFRRENIPSFLLPHIGDLRLGQISEPFLLEQQGYLLKINDDHATIENLIRENRTGATMDQLIETHKAEIHLETRLGADFEEKQPLSYAPS